MYDFDGRQMQHRAGGSGTLELDEAQELELAAELLEVMSEEELAKWVGGIGRAVTDAQRRIGKTYVANQGAVDKTLRVVKLVGMPVRLVSGVLSGLPPDVALRQANQWPEQIDRLRSQVDPHLQRWAQRELQGLSGEDSELELARRYTRFAHRATQHAWRAPRGMAPTRAAAASIRHAAQRDLPGLVPYLPQLLTVEANGSRPAMTGWWHRRGDTIIIGLGEPAKGHETRGRAF